MPSPASQNSVPKPEKVQLAETMVQGHAMHNLPFCQMHPNTTVTTAFQQTAQEMHAM